MIAFLWLSVSCDREKTLSPEIWEVLCISLDATSISQTSATLNGATSFKGPVPSGVSARFYYSSTPGDADFIIQSGQRVSAGRLSASGGDFSCVLSALEPSTTYYYVACTIFHDKKYPGEVKSFTTNDFNAVVTTQPATDISECRATLNGYLYVDSVADLEKSVWFMFSDTATDIEAIMTGGRKLASTLGDSGSFSYNISDLLFNTTYYYVACSKIRDKMCLGALESFTTLQSPEAVDLGLSVDWRAWNIGASGPDGYGDYYAWGELEPYYEDGYAQSYEPVWKSGKTGYDWASYKWYDGYNNVLTKYVTDSSYDAVDNKTVLVTGPDGDDVASKELGGDWRIPTIEEWTELLNNCDWTWITLKGIGGYKVSGKNDNYTDKWIFLPAAGYRRLSTGPSDLGTHGYYWSSSLQVDLQTNAWDMIFSKYVSYITVEYPYERYFGLSVRPVLNKRNP
ncbi:MAG: hypothetical protein IK045_05395 [Bacteroidales bacterium]|nr:hypothetical protein [Bacteroidales bacterium]